MMASTKQHLTETEMFLEVTTKSSSILKPITIPILGNETYREENCVVFANRHSGISVRWMVLNAYGLLTLREHEHAYLPTCEMETRDKQCNNSLPDWYQQRLK